MILFFKKEKKEKEKISDGDSVHSKNTNCYSVLKINANYIYIGKKIAKRPRTKP